MAKGIPVVRIQEPSSEAPPWQGTDAEGSGGSADRLPGVRGSRTQTTQTSKGAVRPEGKPRYYSNPLLSSAVPSKAECLADQRLFLLVREGTYDEVLRELEAAPQHDAEAAWNKAKLLRLVQRHRQRTYGSIRNGVTSKRKELTPEVSASTTQNLDTQLPASERPSGDEVAKRLMHDLAVLQGLQPAPLMKEQAKPVHEQIYVPEAVYAEDDLRRSRASSAQALNRTSTPLTNELPLPQSLSREFSSISFASFASKSSSFASFASKSSSNPLAELSASSNSSERRKGGRRSAPSAPLFVNRHSWNLQHALPANDASHRDRRMNSPVGDTPSRGDWSRLSFSPLEPQKTHGVWGTDWRHPSDIFKTKPGINSSGIKIVNSKEFRRVSALIDDSHLKSLSGVSLSTSVPHRMWPAAPPKMGLVRIARESAQKEAEKFAEENRALRLEQAERDIAGVASQAKGFSETMDEAVFKTIQKAQELWERSFDAMTALDTSTVEQSRMDDMRHLVLKIENEQKKKEQELKAAIKETWKADLVATALQREEATLSSIHATMLAVQEHAASLAADRLEVARKKVEKEEAALERYEQEMSNHSERLEDEQQVSAFSAAGFAEAQAKRDALAREVNELNEEVKEYQHDFARFKTQIFLFESDAYEASRQGKPDIVKTFKEKADAVRAQLAPLGPALAAVEEKLRILNGNLAILEEGVREWENIVHKDQTRLQEMQKVCASDLVRKQELQNKLMFERQEEQELSKRFEERSAAVTATRQKAKEEQDDAESQSDNTVITRLRASSLALVAKTKLLSKDPELDVEEQEPVYIGERLDGKRHGFGILQVCIQFLVLMFMCMGVRYLPLNDRASAVSSWCRVRRAV